MTTAGPEVWFEDPPLTNTGACRLSYDENAGPEVWSEDPPLPYTGAFRLRPESITCLLFQDCISFTTTQFECAIITHMHIHTHKHTLTYVHI